MQTAKIVTNEKRKEEERGHKKISLKIILNIFFISFQLNKKGLYE